VAFQREEDADDSAAEKEQLARRVAGLDEGVASLIRTVFEKLLDDSDLLRVEPIEEIVVRGGDAGGGLIGKDSRNQPIFAGFERTVDFGEGEKESVEACSEPPFS